MKKTFPLTQPKLHPDRVLDAVKHEIRKYLKRERRKPLPEGVELLDFDCRFGLTEMKNSTPTNIVTKGRFAMLLNLALNLWIRKLYALR